MVKPEADFTGLAVNSGDVQEFTENVGIELKSAVLAAIVAAQDEYLRVIQSKTKKLMPKLFDYAKSHHLKIAGDPIEMCHLDEYETDNHNEFITELQLPVH